MVRESKSDFRKQQKIKDEKAYHNQLLKKIQKNIKK